MYFVLVCISFIIYVVDFIEYYFENLITDMFILDRGTALLCAHYIYEEMRK